MLRRASNPAEDVVFKKAAFPGKYIQGAGAVTELTTLIGAWGKSGLILASPSALAGAVPRPAIEAGGLVAGVEAFRGECCERELARVSGVVTRMGIDVIVGIGGGKAIDTAKIIADRARLPVIIVPTIASTDAPCSGCAVVYSENGIFEAVHYQRSNPAVVLVDLDVIAAAPARYLVAGMGDALSTWFEARSCAQTQSVNECGGYGTRLGLDAARLCYDLLLAYGASAKADCERHAVTPALDHIVEANTLLSGIGFESGGLATAHSVHNGLTALPDTHAYAHGEKVAFGVLTGLHLTDAPAEEVTTVYAFCEDVGLPTTLSAVGVDRDDRAKLAQVAGRACAPDQAIHHEPVPSTPERVLDAMLAADARGRERSARNRS